MTESWLQHVIYSETLLKSWKPESILWLSSLSLRRTESVTCSISCCSSCLKLIIWCGLVHPLGHPLLLDIELCDALSIFVILFFLLIKLFLCVFVFFLEFFFLFSRFFLFQVRDQLPLAFYSPRQRANQRRGAKIRQLT